jgi:hypothetical protein
MTQMNTAEIKIHQCLSVYSVSHPRKSKQPLAKQLPDFLHPTVFDEWNA